MKRGAKLYSLESLEVNPGLLQPVVQLLGIVRGVPLPVSSHAEDGQAVLHLPRHLLQVVPVAHFLGVIGHGRQAMPGGFLGEPAGKVLGCSSLGAIEDDDLLVLREGQDSELVAKSATKPPTLASILERKVPPTMSEPPATGRPRLTLHEREKASYHKPVTMARTPLTW